MDKDKIEINVAALLANANAPSPSGVHTFSGDLIQMREAARVAKELGIEVEISYGIPYVKTREEFNQVVDYMISHKIEGYWHYTH